jgi:two-component system chemotaxis response regulator CheB
MNHVVVIGASAGGVKALTALAPTLPADFPAALVVVLHIGAHHSILPDLLTRAGPLPATHVRDNEPVEPARIYVAPPDRHVLLSDGRLRLNRNAKEHHSRPAIDPLFRSAALAYGPGAIGVVLTGRLDDGTAGLQAIKAYGGIAIAQDPADAEVPDMPESAQRYVDVDHCVALASLAGLLVRLTKETPTTTRAPRPKGPAHEQAILLAEDNIMEHLSKLGAPSPFVCPDCHGGLWEVDGVRPRRFRCHTGHAFTIRTLQDSLATTSEESLWNARRALQERLFLLREMDASERGEARSNERLETAAAKLEAQLSELERLMELGPEPLE